MFQKLKDLKTLTGSQEVMCNGSVKEEITKTGKPYLNFTLSDDDTTIYLKIWSNHDKYKEIQEIKNQSLLQINISFDGVKNGYDQYTLEDFKVLTRPSLIDCVDIIVLKDELINIIKTEIEDEEIKKLIQDLFKDTSFNEKIFTAPLTEKSGYSFKGGLLAHIVRKCELSLAIADIYDKWEYNKDGFNAKLNKSVLIASSILSDIGSVFCLDIIDDAVVKTFKGNLNESSYYSAKILIDLLKDSEMLDEKKDYLEHVVTSAKGRLSYGAINTPRTKEANVYHYIQRIDSLMGNFEYMERTSFGEFSKLGEKLYCNVNFDEL